MSTFSSTLFYSTLFAIVLLVTVAISVHIKRVHERRLDKPPPEPRNQFETPHISSRLAPISSIPPILSTAVHLCSIMPSRNELADILEPQLDKIKAAHSVIVPHHVLDLIIDISQKYWPILKNPSSPETTLWAIISHIKVKRYSTPMPLIELEKTLRYKMRNIERLRINEANGPYLILQEQQISQEISSLEEKNRLIRKEWHSFQDNFYTIRNNVNGLINIQGELCQIIKRVISDFCPNISELKRLLSQLIINMNQLNAHEKHPDVIEIADYLLSKNGFELEHFLSYKRLLNIIENDVLVRIQREHFSQNLGDLLHNEITEDDVFNYVATKTGINIDLIRIGTKSKQTLSTNLGKELRRTVIGQDHVIDAIIQTYEVMENGMRDGTKPIVFLLDGASGTGKTHTSKVVGAFLSKEGHYSLKRWDFEKKQLIRDSIESQQNYLNNRFIAHIKTNPNTVVTVDRIDHFDIDEIDYFIEMLDKGYIEDHSGQKVDISGAAFFFNSNATENLEQEKVKLLARFTDPLKKREYLTKIINDKRPYISKTNFLYRIIDGIFRMNDFKEKTKVLLVNQVFERILRPNLRDKLNVDVHLDAEVVWYLGITSEGNGFAVARHIDYKLASPINSLIASGEIERGDFVDVSLKPDGMESNDPFTINVRKDLRGANAESVMRAFALREQRASLEAILENMPDEANNTPLSAKEMDEAIEKLDEEFKIMAQLRSGSLVAQCVGEQLAISSMQDN